MIKQQRLIALQLQQQEFACLHWFLELEDDCQHAVWHPCSGYRPSEEYAKERLFLQANIPFRRETRGKCPNKAKINCVRDKIRRTSDKWLTALTWNSAGP